MPLILPFSTVTVTSSRIFEKFTLPLATLTWIELSMSLMAMCPLTWFTSIARELGRVME